MKKSKILVVALISLILPSCSDNSLSPPDNNNINEENKRLNTVYELPEKTNISSLNENNMKFPAGGEFDSGDVTLIGKVIIDTNQLTENNQIEAENNSLDIQYPNKELLGTYSSKVYTKTEDRQKNLRIVCDKLTGTILKPNQEFSYNTTCGPYNKENGFGKATIFLSDGTEMQDYGGGVCQLSSTLYNAIKNLNIEVTERHNHSKKVYYVPDGQDATVSYGNLDFKFKNLNDFSLLFEASSSAEAVNVNVYKI